MTANTATVVKITLNRLKGLDACKEQLKLFEDTFGKEVSFKTKAQAVKVAVKMAHKFDFVWASRNLLRGGYLKSYNEAEAHLWEAYEEVKAPLWEAYKEAEAHLWEAYEEAKAPLREAYYEAVAPLREAYKEALAKEFAECYFEQEQNQ